MDREKLIQQIETIAPPELAEEWDSCGLLISPPRKREIQTVLLTIDLTEPVAREAVKLGADWIVAYHPVFFGGIRSLTRDNPQARTAMLLIEHGIGVYSPHTALDAAAGGVNDWLAGLFEGKTAAAGSARIIRMKKSASIECLANIIKQKLDLSTIRIAPGGKTVKTLAVCAGAGIETLRGIKADCFLTGEMKHHDILNIVQNGGGVILCGHTETERGYLPLLAVRLKKSCPDVRFVQSKADIPPLKAV